MLAKGVGDLRAQKLQRSIVAYAAIAIFIVGVFASVVAMVPMYELLRGQQEDALAFTASTRALAIQQFLSRSRDTAMQVASRTEIRRRLESYNRGEIELGDLTPFTTLALREALTRSDQIFGITRMDLSGETLVQVGLEIPQAVLEHIDGTLEKPKVYPLISIDGREFLLVAAPVVSSRSGLSGTDVLLFSANELLGLVARRSGLGETGHVLVSNADELNLIRICDACSTPKGASSHTEFPESMLTAVTRATLGSQGLERLREENGTEMVVAYHPIADSGWGIAVSIEAQELDAPVQGRIFGLALVILVLTVAGAVGTVILLRPLSGRVLMEASELAEEVRDKTEALSKSEAWIRSVLDCAGDAIIVFNQRGHIQELNPAAKAMFGCSLETGDKLRIDEFLPRWRGAMGKTGTVAPLLEESDEEQNTAVEIEGRRLDGSLFPVEMTLSRVNRYDDTSYTAIVRDITQRKQVQEELALRYIQLEEAHEKLKMAQAQLLQSEKMASIGQLAAGVAHEINNPVGYINANMGSLRRYVEDLMKLLVAYSSLEEEVDANSLARIRVSKLKQEVDLEFLSRDVVDLISESREGVKRVVAIVQDLRDFAEADGGEWKTLDLHKCLDSALNIAHNEIKCRAEVVREYGELPLVEAIPSQISQVYMNLLVNAAHAIDGQGKITIRTWVDDKCVCVSISDTGSGIPKHLRSRIFEPFFTTKPVGTGTGLGLSVSYGIMQRHAGKIEVESEVGVGSKFTVYMPIRQLNAYGLSSETFEVGSDSLQNEGQGA